MIVVPARRVHDLAGERVDAGDVGRDRFGEQSERTDDEVGGPRAVVGLDAPAAEVVVPVGAEDLVVEADVGEQALFAGDALLIGVDLAGGGVGLGPAGVGGEAERVEVRRHVAAAVRVAVVSPGTADRRRPFEDHEVGATRVEQANGHAHSREAGPDDCGLHVLLPIGVHAYQ